MSLYAYDEKRGDFRLFKSEQGWRSQITVNGVKRYLREHLKKSVVNDFTPAMAAYEACSRVSGVGVGFFGSLRILFPTVTFLGALFKGTDKAKNAIAFMERYLGKVNPRYEKLSDLTYTVYRHGLTHTQMPKVVDIDGWIVGWMITYNDAEHLKVKLDADKKHLQIPISPVALFNDLLRAIDLYIQDFDNPRKRAELLLNFENGFVSMARVFDKKSKEVRHSPKALGYIRKLIAGK